MAVCWDVAPGSLVDINRRIRGAYCLHYQGDDLPGDGHSNNVWNGFQYLSV
jgi:hypothetical protein